MNWYSKFIIGFLALLIMTPSLFLPIFIRTREVQASGFFLTIDIVQEVKEIGADGLTREIARILMTQLASNTLDWAKGTNIGQRAARPFPFAGPKFVSNWNLYLNDTVNAASGLFISELDQTRLCTPFANSLRKQLGTRALRRPSFVQSSSCTLDRVIQNISDFQNDFRNGGWTVWNTSLQTNNNYFGSFLLAEDHRIRRAVAANIQADKQEKDGFVGEINCKRGGWTTTSDGDEVCTQPQVATPAKTAADIVNSTIASEFSWLSTTDEIAEIIGTFVGSAIFNVVSDGLLFRDNEDPRAGNPTQPWTGPKSSNPPPPRNATCQEWQWSEASGECNAVCIDWQEGGNAAPIPPAPANCSGGGGGGGGSDSDGDGVLNSIDQCPGTPAGTPVNSVGCPTTPPAGGNLDSGDEAVIFEAAQWVRNNNDSMFVAVEAAGGKSTVTGRSISYDIMTIVIDRCRAGGTDCQRCLANANRPAGDPFRYCSDAVWVGAPSGGCDVDLYGSFALPGTPQTLVQGCGLQSGGL